MGFDNIKWAESVITSTYGDGVSVAVKAKSLIKFGENDDIDTGEIELVWGGTGLEILPTGNTIDTISSSNEGDTRTVVIEGHTIDGNGDFTFVTQTATLNGQTKVVLDTPMARANRMYNNTGVAELGVIYCYEDTAIVSGVPTDVTKEHVQIKIGEEQSLKCASTISKDDHYIVTGLSLSVKKTTSATVDFACQLRLKGGVFRTQFPFTLSSTSGGIHIPFDPPFIIPSNSDWRVTCSTSANNTSANAIVHGYLAKIVS